MNILIVGGTGFIGEALYNYVGGRDSYRYIFVSPHPFRYSFKHFANCDLVPSDWRTANYPQIVTDYNIDKALVLACGSHPRSSNIDIFNDQKNNVFTIVNVLQQLISAGVSQFVYTSSSEALNTCQPNSHLQQTSSYAIGKIFIESLLTLLNSKEQIQHQIIRIPNPFGPFQDGVHGQGIFPIFAKTLATSGTPDFFADHTRKKGYIYIFKVIDVIVKTLHQASLSNSACSIIPDIYLNSREIYNLIKHDMETPSPKTANARPLNQLFSTSYSLQQEVRNTLAWLADNKLLGNT